MSLRSRIITPFAILAVAAVVGLGTVIAVELKGSSDSHALILRFERVVKDLNSVVHFIKDAEGQLNNAMAMTGLTDHATVMAGIDTELAAVRETITNLRGEFSSDEVSAAFTEFDAAIEAWHSDARVLLGAEAAAEIPSPERIRRESEELIDLNERLLDLAEGEVDAIAARQLQTARMIVLGAGALILVSILVVLGLALRNASGISRSVASVADSLSRLAGQHRPDASGGTGGGDEIATMLAALSVLQDSLSERDALVAREREEAALAKVRARQQAERQAEIGRLVASALRGEFGGRLNVDGADAGSRHELEQMNALFAGIESVIMDVSQALDRFAAGDLSARMEGNYGGLMDQLKRNLNSTGERLQHMVADIRATSSGLADAIGGIVTGADGLSNRSQQQAAALEELAATMEEMSRAVRSHAETAANADSLSKDVARSAAEGTSVAKGAVAAIQRINESTSRITDVVGLVESIAFQTNLLALNAAVEAARAGESGKGFAVVAAEVRGLAQRAGDAAKEIKTLVEQSAANVSDGVRLVQSSGSALSQIREGIEQLAQSLSSISDAGQEQAPAVSEVSSAVAQLDATTQDNARLAAESAATSAGMDRQAQQLLDLVAFFDGQRTGGSLHSAA
jgi:methyl-accepting chemotaxis protein